MDYMVCSFITDNTFLTTFGSPPLIHIPYNLLNNTIIKVYLNVRVMFGGTHLK